MGIGSLAGAGVSALGGVASSILSNKAAENVNLLNYKQAKEFAQNQIQWKVADAKKAGLHPLAALGMSPVMGPSATAVGDFSGLGAGLDQMGQNISRAIDAYQTQDQRDAEARKAEELADMRMAMEQRRFQQDIAESNARIREHDARTNSLLNPIREVQRVNYIKGSSFRRGAQPRLPARPRVKSRGETDGTYENPHRDYDWFIDRRGNKYLTTSERRAQATQNSWVADIPFYVNEGFHDLYDGWKDVFR